MKPDRAMGLTHLVIIVLAFWCSYTLTGDAGVTNLIAGLMIGGALGAWVTEQRDE